MSEMEFYKGILTLIGENAEEKAKKFYITRGFWSIQKNHMSINY